MTLHNHNPLLAALLLLALCSALTAAPVANAGSDQTTTTGQNVTFNGASSVCSSCSIVSYSWNFGDNGTATGVSTTHSYSSAASYTVTLTVVSNSSDVSSDTITITVQSGDATPPVINQTNATTWTQNTSLPISATVTDNVGVSSVLLYYEAEGAGAYSSTSMTANANVYSGTIPNSSTNGSFVLYYITASDAASNSVNGPSGGSSTPVNVTLTATDTTSPITTLISVSNDSSSPYWVTTSNATSSNAQVLVSGESGMLCRMGQSNSNYSGMTVGYVDCTIGGSTANCSETLGDNNYTRYVACKDSSGNEQNSSQTINVSFGVDSTTPTAISAINSTEFTGRIFLNWSAVPTDATSGLSVQKVQRSTNCGSTYSTIASVGSTITAYNDTTGTSGNTYCYRIYGQDTAGTLQSSSGTTSPVTVGVPIISALSSSVSGTTATLSATTTENASCRYSASNVGYSSMTTDFTTGQNVTSHSVSVTGSGSTTLYASCIDVAGNAMTTANSTVFAFTSSSSTATSSSSSSTGGGSSGSPKPSTAPAPAAPPATPPATPPSTQPAAPAYVPPAPVSATMSVAGTALASGRSVAYDSASGRSTVTLSIANNGVEPTGPLVVREEIPDSVATDAGQLIFSPPPTRFERGSIIAVWELADGLGVGQSFVVSYSVAKPVTSFDGFKTTAEALAPAAANPAVENGAQTTPPAAAPGAPNSPGGASAASPDVSSGVGALLSVVTVVVVIIAIGAGAYLLLGRRKRRGL